MTGNVIFPGVFLCCVNVWCVFVCVLCMSSVCICCFFECICILCVCVVIHYGTDNVFLFPILLLLL